MAREQPHTRGIGGGRTDDRRPFVRLVQADGTVCNNCFRRRYDVTPRNPTRTSRKGVVTDEWDGRHGENVPVPNELAAQGMDTACATCGEADGATRRPLSREQVVELAENLIELLEDDGIPHDENTLRETAVRLHRSPETSCAEDLRVFAPAYERAIRDGGMNPDRLYRASHGIAYRSDDL